MKPPQLSLRDFFWLILVAGMGCGWFVTTFVRFNRVSEVFIALVGVCAFVVGLGAGLIGREAFAKNRLP